MKNWYKKYSYIMKEFIKKFSMWFVFWIGIIMAIYSVFAFQWPTWWDTNPATAWYTSSNSWISTTLTAIKAKTDTISASWGGWCYRKTCEVHNATSCTVAACGAWETDKWVSCPRNWWIWSIQDNPTNIMGTNCIATWWCWYGTIGNYGSKLNADYYVTCERWCCL